MPGVSGVTVVTNSRVFFYTRGCGRTKRPAFPAPSDFRGGMLLANLARMRGEIAEVRVLDGSRRIAEPVIGRAFARPVGAAPHHEGSEASFRIDLRPHPEEQREAMRLEG